MIAHLVLFTKQIGWYGNKEGIYRRHYMLDFRLFMAVNSANSYL